MSSAGASILGIGYLIPLIYLFWSIRYGPVAGPNPWGAKGLEWETPSPPPTENFEEIPAVTEEAYAYANRRARMAEMSASSTHTAAAHSAAGHPPGLRHHFEDMEQQHEAGNLGMWVFLVTEILFFGGLFAAYAIYRSLYLPGFEAGSRLLDVKLGATNTAVLIGSSLTMAMAVHSAQTGKRKALILFLLLTMALGAVFLGIKADEYAQKWQHGLVPGLKFAPDEEIRGTRRSVPWRCFFFFTFS